MLTLLIVFFLTFLVEAIVEYLFGRLFDQAKLTPYRWLLMYIAATFGVGVALYYQLDLIAILAAQSGLDNLAEPTLLGMVLTGLAMGRGSNFVHQLVARFFPQRK